MILTSKPRRFLAVGALFVGLFWCGGVARALDRDKVRAAVPLPGMNLGFFFNFNIHPDGPPDARPAPQQIAELEAAPPSTSEGWVRLSRLYLQTKNWARAKATSGYAATLLQAETEAAPRDMKLLVRLGKAQNGAGQSKIAEATLRRATELAPDNAEALNALSDVQMEQATKLLLPSENGFDFAFGAKTATYSGLSQALLDGRPTPEIIAEAKELFLTAQAGHIRAVRIAPLSADIYLQRAVQRPSETFLSLLLRSLNNGKNVPLKTAIGAGLRAYATLISPESAADLQVVARLNPRDASANAVAALASLVSFSIFNGRAMPLKGDLESLPAPVSNPVRDNIERLETLAQGGAKDEATALEALGSIAYILDDSTAKDKLRRAVLLDPTRVQARELLLGLLATDKNFEEMTTILQSQLAREDSARYRLLLAKADDKLGRAADAEVQVNAALKLEPGDITANLARAALDLRAGDAARASESLTRTAKLMAPEANATAKQKSDYAVLQAALLALNGEVEAAKVALQAIVAADPNDKSAQQVLDALNA